MGGHGLVFGLLDTSGAIRDRSLASKSRELTITWSRYDYHGTIIERPTIDAIIAQAGGQGFRYCFILSYGQILRERWVLDQCGHGNFIAALEDWLAEHEVLVAGRILRAGDGWYGLDHRCLLVDTQLHAQCRRPPFGRPEEHLRDLPGASEATRNGQIARLSPTGRAIRCAPGLRGWGFIQASLDHGIAVLALPEWIEKRVVDLEPKSTSAALALTELLGDGIDSYGGRGREQIEGLTDDQAEFLAAVSLQTANARRGVFLLNIEAYTDVETPPPDFPRPVSSLYAVASGFKPNRILQTHGMGEDTRVVFFDYSRNALAVRKTIVEQWDGEDFPHFIRYLFKTFPPLDTFYQLWTAATPDAIGWATVERLWEREITRLGGERAFREHWRRYRELRHEYIHCDVLAAPERLLARIWKEPSAVIWFSNAPFTVYSNWRYSLDERKAMYDRWMERLAALNPEMLLYGSDYNNSNVNCVSAGEYWELYRNEDRGPLDPCNIHQHEVRM